MFNRKTKSNKICCVVNCPNNKNTKKLEDRSYFSIPRILNGGSAVKNNRRKKRHDAWCAFLNTQSDILYSKIKDPRICSNHFHSGKPAPEAMEEDIDWTPTLNPPAKKLITQVSNHIQQVPKSAGARETLTYWIPKRNNLRKALSSRKAEPLPPNKIVSSNSVTDEDDHHPIEPTTFVACAVLAEDLNNTIKEEIMDSLDDDVRGSSSNFDFNDGISASIPSHFTSPLKTIEYGTHVEAAFAKDKFMEITIEIMNEDDIETLKKNSHDERAARPLHSPLMVECWTQVDLLKEQSISIHKEKESSCINDIDEVQLHAGKIADPRSSFNSVLTFDRRSQVNSDEYSFRLDKSTQTDARNI